MDLEKILKEKFSKINRAFFEEEFDSLFLRVEVSTTKLTEVENISREISEFLDDNYNSKKEYFLDVYSEGSDVFFNFENAKDHLDRNIKVDLVKSINHVDFLVGKLKAANNENIELWVNNKGHIKKNIITKAEIKNLSIFVQI